MCAHNEAAQYQLMHHHCSGQACSHCGPPPPPPPASLRSYRVIAAGHTLALCTHCPCPGREGVPHEDVFHVQELEGQKLDSTSPSLLGFS